MAEYPGSAYTTNPQNTGNDFPGDATRTNAAGYNKHDGEIEAITGDLRAGMAAHPSTLVNTAEKYMDMEASSYLHVGGFEVSRVFGIGATERMVITGQLNQGFGSGGLLQLVTKPGPDGNITFDAAGKTITQTGHSINFEQAGFGAACYVTVQGSASNNGTYLVDSVVGAVITLDAGETLINEGPSASITLNAYSVALLGAAGEGIYKVSARMSFSYSVAAELTIKIRKNGVDFPNPPAIDVGAGVKTITQWSAVWDVSDGDFFDLLITVDNAGTMSVPFIYVDIERQSVNVLNL